MGALHFSSSSGHAGMPIHSGQIPPLPEFGRPETYYAQQVQQAEEQLNFHLREAAKVGQYVSLALDNKLPWEQRLKYFCHALRKHCLQPEAETIDPPAIEFYQKMADLVRRHCGHHALRLASAEDDLYAARLALGQPREEIEEEAEEFFAKLVPSQCPDYFLPEDYAQLKLIRDQWI